MGIAPFSSISGNIETKKVARYAFPPVKLYKKVDKDCAISLQKLVIFSKVFYHIYITFVKGLL